MTDSPLTEVAIRDFQSLKKVNVPLGRFTAIVGPSNTGKSAIVRALRTLARNGSSTGLVRDGAASLSVVAAFEDGTYLTVQRGARLSKAMILTPDGEKTEFAKLGLEVPDEAKAIWRLADGELGDLTFSTQHDGPYMVSASPSGVAKQVGQLTNAAILMEAVREANRRRNEAAQDAKYARREVEEAAAELRNLTDVREERALLEEAEKHVDSANEAYATAMRLATLMAKAAEAEDVRKRATEAVGRLNAQAGASTMVEGLAERLGALGALLDARNDWTAKAEKAHTEAESWTLASEDLQAEANEMLRAAGRCPLCEQETT